MDQRVHAAIAFMNTNLQRRLMPIEIAESVRLSPTHLRRLFKTETDSSLAQYLRELRLDRAKQLLETTFLSIKEIGASVGLTDVSHFVRDFKQAYRLTPTAYGELNR